MMTRASRDMMEMILQESSNVNIIDVTLYTVNIIFNFQEDSVHTVNIIFNFHEDSVHTVISLSI